MTVRRDSLKSFILSTTPESSRDSTSPAIHRCRSACRAVSRRFGSTTSSFRMKSRAGSDTLSQYLGGTARATQPRITPHTNADLRRIASTGRSPSPPPTPRPPARSPTTHVGSNVNEPRQMSRKSADWFGFANGAYLPCAVCHNSAPRSQRAQNVHVGNRARAPAEQDVRDYAKAPQVHGCAVRLALRSRARAFGHAQDRVRKCISTCARIRERISTCAHLQDLWRDVARRAAGRREPRIRHHLCEAARAWRSFL